MTHYLDVMEIVECPEVGGSLVSTWQCKQNGDPDGQVAGWVPCAYYRGAERSNEGENQMLMCMWGGDDGS